MSLEALVKAGGNGRYDKVQVAIDSLPEERSRLLIQVLSDPQFTNPQIASAVNQDLADCGIHQEISSEQVRYYRQKIREGKVHLG